ncbi:hypothetical protein Tco_0931084 [Tanacetum coccineum]
MRQNTQPRTAAGEGTNISRAGHTNIVENAQAVCNEPINSVCLHTRDSNDVVPSVLTQRKRTNGMKNEELQVVVMLSREISGHLQNGSMSTSMALNFGSIDNEQSSSELAARNTKAAAKRPLLPQPSLEAKKKKGDYTCGRKNIE